MMIIIVIIMIICLFHSRLPQFLTVYMERHMQQMLLTKVYIYVYIINYNSIRTCSVFIIVFYVLQAVPRELEISKRFK